MGKISKRRMQLHEHAMDVVNSDRDLEYKDLEFVFNNYHEGATNMNSLVSAHFTPYSIAYSVAQNARNWNFVDLCAGIGMLAWAVLRQQGFWKREAKLDFKGVCVELNEEYYRVGKRLLPEFLWINGDITDMEVIDKIKDYFAGEKFTIISNPPYGNQVKTNAKKLLKYKGAEFEYKAIEVGALLGAEDGVFLLSQQAVPFRMSGKESRGGVYSPEYRSKKYISFEEDTDLIITPNAGYSTDINDNDGWKDVNVITEIAIIEYCELDYVPKNKKVNQIAMF